MDLQEIVYKRIDIEQVQNELKFLLQQFIEAKNAPTCIEAIANFNDVFARALDADALVSTRFDLNTNDSFYKEESKYYDREFPFVNNLMVRFYSEILKSPFKTAIEEKLGKVFFQLAQLSELEKDSVFVENNQRMNEISRKYFRMRSLAKIEVRGQTYSLQGVNRILEDADRMVRKEALDGFWGFMEQNSGEIDGIFLELRKIRQKTAMQLGHQNFVKLGYLSVKKYDYTPKHMAVFREQVYKTVRPLFSKIIEAKRKRLGYEKVYYYDTVSFKTGNAQLKGDLSTTIENCTKTFTEMSPETAKLWNDMIENNWFDFSNNKNKKQGANYCRTFPSLGKPFINTFFTGTTRNITTIFHEFGHAFQKAQSREVGKKWFDYFWSTPDIAEIHSNSMEFFAWNWYPLFFGEDTQKFRYQKLTGALSLLLSVSVIDEFQHFIYENPNAAIEEVEAKYIQILRHYKPSTNYADNTFLKKGGHWRSMTNVISAPFHNISYALSTVCALQFWKKSQEDFEGAWHDYLRLCKVGGSVGFKEALKIANLKSPFEEGTLKEVVGFVTEWLEGVDTSEW